MKIIRSLAIAVALASSTLAGCVTTTDPVTGAVTSGAPTMADVIAAVQAACTTACKFVPTATTIANIISAGNPGVVTATAISNAICSAIAPAPVLSSGPLHRGNFRSGMVTGVLVDGWVVSNKYSGTSTVPKVSGVPIRGTFVN